MTPLEIAEEELRAVRQKVAALRIAQAISRKEETIQITISNQHTFVLVSVGSEQIATKAELAKEILANISEFLENI